MKKYCDYYFTIKQMEPGKWTWTIREKNGAKIMSSLDEDCEFEPTYSNEVEAEINCREAISDHYY